ncbi:MAG: ferrous iron transport protein B [Acutalibacter sp.]|jgi:ferrous iron transport protein B|nr:ferrous iron transport protein B [Acutalibacter sp.]
MEIKIALAGNPNCGKTTLFNALTGSNQYVGNWPGVTVEKKEGRLKGDKEVAIQDLPGIYSLSPYTLEEEVARGYLLKERPDAILNIVDGTNIERSLYLTTQLLELGLPLVVAVNMMDLLRKSGDKIDLKKLEEALHCPVVELSALKGEGSMEAARRAVELAQLKRVGQLPPVFTGSVEQAIVHIEESVSHEISENYLRWYAVKIFERDEKVMAQLNLSNEVRVRLEERITQCEKELDDDAESIITNQRYSYINSVVSKAVKKKTAAHSLSASDKIDRVVTNRILALPIFVVVMFLVYAIAMGGWKVSIGTALTDWANDGLFGDGWLVPFVSDVDGYDEAAGAFEEASAIIEGYEAGDSEIYLYDDETGETETVALDAGMYAEAQTVEEPDPRDYGTWVPGFGAVSGWLEKIGCAGWLNGLISDGIIGGVGAVLGFVPQMLVLFLLLSILEDVGYMARIAFIMDRIFRKFGLSGKSFIPMLVGTGCGVPGVMASRTIENERDRRMTVMTTCFVPCGAKMPIIALFAGALFGGSTWVTVSAYFIGVAAIVISGIILKKTKMFAGDPAPFVMELPAYHVPSGGNVLRATWERGWSFIKRAGTIILASSIILWFLQGFGFENGAFGMVEDNNSSLLAMVGSVVAIIFAPLGFGTWQAAVATITGLIAKEEVVSTFGVLYPGNLSAEIALAYSPIAAYSFMIFNLLCAPCFAAMGAIKREMNNWKWSLGAIGYMCAFAYLSAFVVFQIGSAFAGGFGIGTVLALAVLAGVIYLMARRNPYDNTHLTVSAAAAAGK